MTQTITRNMTNEELMDWVEAAPTAEEQQERAEHANAGYPVMIDEEHPADGEVQEPEIALVQPAAKQTKIAPETHVNISKGDIPETDEELEKILAKLDIKDSAKHARQARLKIVRKDAQGNALTDAQVAEMEAKAAVAAAAKVAAQVEKQSAKARASATPKVVAPKTPKPEKVAKVAEPVLGRWHGVTCTLQMILDMHAEARNGMSREAIQEKHGLDPNNFLAGKPWIVERANKVAKDCGIAFVYPEAFVYPKDAKAAAPKRSAKKVATPAVESTPAVVAGAQPIPSQVVPSQESATVV